MTTDNDGNLKIHPPITVEEHQQVQREDKARTILLSALPYEHMEEGLDKGYDKMQKILTQMNTLKIKPDLEDINMKFLRGLPSSWSGIALILKTKGGLEYISFDDLYNKLKFLEIDTKGYSSSSPTLSNVAFGSPESKCSVVDDVLYSFFANHEIDKQLIYEDLDQINKDEFKKYDLKHQMAMLSIKVHRFEKKHGRMIKFNGRENARFDKKLVKCFNCKQMGHFSRECQAQGAQTSNNYQKYKSKEAGKDGFNSRAMVVVDGSIDWDTQTEESNTEPRSLENFSMIAGINLESDDDSEGEVVSADAVISADVSISAGLVAAVVISLYSMSVRTKEGLGLDKYIGEGEFDIDDSVFSIFHTTSDDLEGQPIYNSDRSSKPSTNDFQTCDSSQECSRTNQSDHDSNDSISNVSAPASASSDTIVIDCVRQKDFPSVCSSSIKTDVKSSKTLCNKLRSFNKESHFRKHKSVTSKSCYLCGSYLHLIKDCDFHEQTFTKRNAEGKGKLGRRPTGKPINLNRPNPVSAGQRNTVSAG
nr:hypothetical protein [Tanacetum cinerariifolium]